MSIQPVQLNLPTPPPQKSGRQANEIPSAPVAPSQSGALPIPGDANATGLSGTGSATKGQAVSGQPTPTDAHRSPERDALIKAVEHAQELISGQARDFSFSVHEETGKLVVRIVDRESKEVIRQIPAEEMLRLAEQIKALEGDKQPGLLLKQEA